MTYGPEFKVRIIDSFRSYWHNKLASWSDAQGRNGYWGLDSYIVDWLKTGPAVEVTNADFPTFLQAVMVIIEAYENDPSIIDYEGDASDSHPECQPCKRRVKRITTPDTDNPVASPETYRKWLTLRLRPPLRRPL